MNAEITGENTVQLGQGTKTEAQPVTGSPKNGYYWGTGRRKTSGARVRVKTGSGKITINDQPMEQFFKMDRDRSAIMSVLTKTNNQGKVDVFAEVDGGGFTGQAGAVVLGLSRALKLMDAAAYPILRDGSFLTRDPRMKERKKYGKRGARRSYQFSKR
jgi:small subunit ribosomal protein S9